MKYLRFLLPAAFLQLSFGGGGGDSSQSSATTSTTTTTTNVADKRVVADNGATVIGDGSNVTMTDLGSIQAALDLGEKAIVGATKVATDASTKAGELADKALAMSQKTIDGLQDAYESGGKVLAIGAAVLLGWMLLSNNGKK